MHFDWGASQSLSEHVFIGLVGYVDKEIGCDSGAGNRVGCFRSQVAGIGPQVGSSFPAGNLERNLTLKAYTEFGAESRPDGWNAWITLDLSRPRRQPRIRRQNPSSRNDQPPRRIATPTMAKATISSAVVHGRSPLRFTPVPRCFGPLSDDYGTALLAWRCPLRVISVISGALGRCPFLPRKRPQWRLAGQARQALGQPGQIDW